MFCADKQKLFSPTILVEDFCSCNIYKKKKQKKFDRFCENGRKKQT